MHILSKDPAMFRLTPGKLLLWLLPKHQIQTFPSKYGMPHDAWYRYQKGKAVCVYSSCNCSTFAIVTAYLMGPVRRYHIK